MSHDEVEHGNESEGGPSYGWYLVIAVAVVVALVSMLGRHHPASKASPRPLPTLGAVTTPAPTPPPSAAGTPTPVPDPAFAATSAVVVVPSGPAGPVRSVAVCPATRPTLTSLAVSFVLLNPTAETERVVSITPRTPTAGLRATELFVRTGGCVTDVGTPRIPAGVAIKPGKSIVVVMRFELPDACPQPVPVGANVTVTGSRGPIVTSLPLFEDLGSVQFQNCPVKSAGD